MNHFVPLLVISLRIYAADATSSPMPLNGTLTLNCSQFFDLLKTRNITRLQVPFSCEKYPVAGEVLLGIVLTFIVVGAVGGNFLVILAVILVQKLRTPSNILIVNLATSDFLVSLFVMPIMVYMQINRFRWPFSESFCDVYLSWDVLLCTSSILNLCAISIDRYLVITRPMTYTPRRTNVLMGGMIASAWGISALISIPPAIGWKDKFHVGVCQYSEILAYQIYATLGAFYIPLFIMLVLYYRIFRLARKMAHMDAERGISTSSAHNQTAEESGGSLALVNSEKGAHHGQRANSSTTGEDSELLRVVTVHGPSEHRNGQRSFFKSLRAGNSSSGPKIATGHKKKTRATSDSKAIRTLGVIMGCFTLCWLPFFIIQIIKPVLIVQEYDPAEFLPNWLFELFLWLGYLNSFLNPIIYAKFNREFRNPFKEILLCHCGSINRRIRSDAYNAQYGSGGGGGGGSLSVPPSGPRRPSSLIATGTTGGASGHLDMPNRTNRRRSSDPFTPVGKRSRLSTTAPNHGSSSTRLNHHGGSGAPSRHRSSGSSSGQSHTQNL